jgi:hypothetical protein
MHDRLLLLLLLPLLLMFLWFLGYCSFLLQRMKTAAVHPSSYATAAATAASCLSLGCPKAAT